jgi:hypothetical protein
MAKKQKQGPPASEPAAAAAGSSSSAAAGTRIRMLVSVSGADWSAAPGEVVERPAAEADRYIASGQAEAV